MKKPCNRPPLGIPTPSPGSSDLLPWFRPTGFHFFGIRNEEVSRLGVSLPWTYKDLAYYVQIKEINLCSVYTIRFYSYTFAGEIHMDMF